MSSYLFQLELATSADELWEVIPAQREHVNRLLIAERILSYSVSAARNMLWCVIAADNESDAMEAVLDFPLYPYFSEVSCYPLLFHNTTFQTALPGMSPN